MSLDQKTIGSQVEPTPLQAAGGSQTTINTAGGDYAEGNIDKRQGEIFVEGNVYGDVVKEKYVYYQTATTPLDRQQQRNRRAMLSKVKTIWIDGLLEQSLAKETRIVLNLEAHPNAVGPPLNVLVQELNRPPAPLSPGKPIIDIFGQMNGALLILGAPGAGKTTLLLELARNLIARAEQDEGHPIPVVFNLSTWVTSQRPLKDWLVEELNLRYDVPKKVAQQWVSQDAVLPLLDSLDEVAPDRRDACAETINAYRQEHGLLPLAVCSRMLEYESLVTKLRLDGAIAIRSLDRQQINAYLEQGEMQLTGVRAALATDTTLLELLDNPLMLSIVTLAYAGTAASELVESGTAAERRSHLFTAYLDRMFQRRRDAGRFGRQQTVHGLSWLATQMVSHSQTVFYIERLQPDWLHHWTRLGYAFRVGLLSFVVGALVGGPLGGLVLGGLVGALVGALVVGLPSGLVGGFLSSSAVIRPVETLRWSWGAAGGGHQSSLVIGLLYALGVGFGVGLGVGPVEGPFSGLIFGLIFGLAGWIVGWLASELAGETIAIQSFAEKRPFRRFIWCLLIGGLLFGLIGGLVGGLGAGLIDGLVGVLIGALIGGLLPSEQGAPTGGDVDLRRTSRNALVAGLLFGLGGALFSGPVGALGGGLASTFVWFASWLNQRSPHGTTVRHLMMRRFARNTLSGGLLFGLGGGLLFGLGGALNGGIDGALGGALVFGLGGTLIFGLSGGLVGGVLSGLVEGEVAARTVANEGIHRAGRTALVSILVSGLIFGLVAGLIFQLLLEERAGLIFGPIFGLIVGLVFLQFYGGATYLQHYTLRWLLYRHGHLPLRLVPFLDYCAERIFLRKVGGGYIFVHRLLMEHFASLYDETGKVA